MIIRLIIWIIFFYFIYRFIRGAIQSAVNRGIRDYETKKEKQQRKEMEVKVDRSKIEDAKYKDIR